MPKCMLARMRRWRWIVWTIGLLIYVAVLMVLATAYLTVISHETLREGFSRLARSIFQPDEWTFGGVASPYWWMYCGGPAIVIATSQFIFLVPAGVERPRQGVGSRSLTLSLVAAGIPAGLLLAGLVYAATDAAILLGNREIFNEMWVTRYPPALPEEIGLGMWLLAIVRFP